jgi:flagellar motor switch protein FliN/FliY
MTTQEALQATASKTAAALADVLAELTGDDVAPAEVSVPVSGADPLEAAETPAVMISADYAGGAQGGNVLVIPAPVAARIAGRDADAELGEEDVAELVEPLQRAMAAVATATGRALGEDVETQEPEIRLARARGDLKAPAPSATRTTVAVLTVFGEPCRLVGLVPTVFTMRMTQTLTSGPTETGGEAHAAVRQALRDVPLRVWAELGRARLRTVDVAALGDGSIVDLDHAADDPVDVYVNGSRIGTGRLIRIEESDWAVRLEHVFAVAEPGTPAEAA